MTLKCRKRIHVKRTCSPSLSNQRICDLAVVAGCILREPCTKIRRHTRLVSFAWQSLPVRSHLKSLHIADKRNNFHIALNPPLPCSNESVIDNGRNVSLEGSMGVRYYPRSLNLPKQCCLYHTGALLRRFGIDCELKRWQTRTVEEEYDFCSFFLHVQKWAAGEDLYSVSKWSWCGLEQRKQYQRLAPTMLETGQDINYSQHF